MPGHFEGTLRSPSCLLQWAQGRESMSRPSLPRSKSLANPREPCCRLRPQLRIISCCPWAGAAVALRIPSTPVAHTLWYKPLCRHLLSRACCPDCTPEHASVNAERICGHQTITDTHEAAVLKESRFCCCNSPSFRQVLSYLSRGF